MTDIYASPTIDNAINASIRKPAYFTHDFEEADSNKQLIQSLGLVGHREGGFFRETDRSPFKLQNPFYNNSSQESAPISTTDSNDHDQYRNYSTLIYYLLTPQIPFGRLHKNLNRIIHILQKGRGQYVLIYPDGKVHSFIVGFDHAKGEVSQWVVPGGVWKASFLLPLNDKESSEDHLLISEVVVPGFEYDDHEFLPQDVFEGLVGEEKAKELSFLQTDSAQN